MIVVISDLHFEEEASDKIPGRDGRPDLVFRRNRDPKAYRNFIAEMAWRAEMRKVREFDLVIAGDLFDFNRTTLWFNDELRPYTSLKDVSPELVRKILAILEATAAEPAISEALGVFQLLARGRYQDYSGEEKDFPVERIRVNYLSGNHDRLCNATPAIRQRISQLLGLSGHHQFAHYAFFEELGLLIRHGHEYDANNFAIDPEKLDVLPLEIPEEGYAESNFGDFVTIDIAVRLPYLLRQKYGDEEILKDPVLSTLYLRLLQFDDVRPQSALLDYLLDDSHDKYSAEEAWERLMPIIQQVVDEIHDHPFFRYWVNKRAKPWAGMELEATRELMKLGGWKNRVARETARKIAHFMMGGDIARPQLVALREEVLKEKKVRLILAGHTHTPEVCLLATDGDDERYYVNTGTWRSRIPSTADERSFGRVDALTYVQVLAPHERREGEGSFSYWTGVTRDWSAPK